MWTDFETQTKEPPSLLDKTNPPNIPDNHNELIEKIQKEKEEFIRKKKKEEEEKKKVELEKIISSKTNTSALGVDGGEPADPITKQRRNFVKKVGWYSSRMSLRNNNESVRNAIFLSTYNLNH